MFSTSKIFYPLLVCVLAGVVTGCASSLVMDTAQSLERGKTQGVSGFGVGWQEGGLLTYEPPTHPEWPEWRQVEEGEVPYEFSSFQMEWFGRISYGIGLGLQADFSILAPTPVGLGLGLGLKWELPLPRREVFAMALAARGGGSVGGNSSAGYGATYTLLSADYGPILSIHYHRAHAIYFSPRQRHDLLYHRSFADDHVASSSGTSTSYSAALGWRIGRTMEDDLFMEATLIYSPLDQGDDGLRYVLGIGGTIPGYQR